MYSNTQNLFPLTLGSVHLTALEVRPDILLSNVLNVIYYFSLESDQIVFSSM